MARYADVAEGVRAALAAYAQALDDGRIDDVVATFCPDASCDIPGVGTPTGHDELRQAFAEVAPRVPQRHVVVNTVITDWDERNASAVSDLVFLLRGEAGWSVVLVGRYTDTLHQSDGTWRFHHRALTFVT